MNAVTPGPFAEHMGAVARALFGKPNPLQSKQGKPRWGNKGSVAVDERRGIWFDHENDTGGGVLALIEREKGLIGAEAIAWLESIGCRVESGKTNGSKRPRSADTKTELLETFDYLDQDGSRLFQVVRFGYRKQDGSLVLAKSGKPEKTFRQRRPDPDESKLWVWGLGAGKYMRKGPGQDWYHFDDQRWAKLPASRERKIIAAAAKSVPYRLAEMIEAIANGHPVLIVEGEQKANLLETWNLCATCNAEGAGKWTVEHASYLRGADVVILPDQDEKGREHAQAVAQTLHRVAASIRVLELPGLGAKDDVIDWAKAGGTREQLDGLIEQTSEWKPDGRNSISNESGESDPDVVRMNARYSIVQIGGKTRVATLEESPVYRGCRVPIFSTISDFAAFHAREKKIVTAADGTTKKVGIGRWWINHPERQQYDNIVYAPGANDETKLNLWSGFGCEARQSDCSLYVNHLRNNICCGNHKYTNYLLDWMAYAVQRPGQPGEVAVVLRGKEGTGKGVFAKEFGRLFGAHFRHVVHAKHLTGHFNAHLQQCSVLFADEAFFAGDRSHESTLKALITEETLLIEPKGIDPHAVRNCIHLIMSSNNDWVVPAGSDARRYFVLNVSDAYIQDYAYFAAIAKQMSNGGRGALLYQLLERDLAGFDVRHVPQTEGLAQQKAHSRRGVDRLVEIIAHNGIIPAADTAYANTAITTGEDEGKGFYPSARILVPDLKHVSSIVIAAALKEQWQCKMWKSGYRRGLAFPPLAELRHRFNARHGPQDWPEITEWESSSE